MQLVQTHALSVDIVTISSLVNCTKPSAMSRFLYPTIQQAETKTTKKEGYKFHIPQGNPEPMGFHPAEQCHST
jgi:hypothetical protein